MRALFRRPLLAVIAATTLVGAGCEPAPPPAMEFPPAKVEVSQPRLRTVTDYEETTGRIDAIDSVQLRARVSGYLSKINFTDGDDVKKGSVLFEIDARPYKAQFDQDQADLANKKAKVEKTKKLYDRTLSLRASGGSTQEDIDNQLGDHEIAKAGFDQAEAKLRASRLMLDWTEVRSPINGRASRKLITEGNLVTADSTILTTIVSLERVFVYLFVDERTLLRMRSAGRLIPNQSAGRASIVAEIGLAYEEGYSLKGTINFEDNQVDAGTGTKLLRAEVENFKAPDGQWFLSPGLFARIRVPMGEPKEAVLIADRAVSSDQGKKFVYVVVDKADAKTGKSSPTVEKRYVHLGGLHDGLREVLSSVGNAPLPANQRISADDQVVVSGVQRVQPGFPVDPKVVPMPGAK